jgi:UPF0755 protein
MVFIRNTIILLLVTVAVLGGGLYYWSQQAIITEGEPLAFTVLAGSGVAGSAEQIAAAGIPVNPALLILVARLSGKSAKLKAGSYELKPGTTPLQLVGQLARGEFAQESLAIIEGWTFHQMREAVAANRGLKHDTVALSDRELLAKLNIDYASGEGLFFPDTYLFAKGSSDLPIYRQAHGELKKRLEQAWAQRDVSLPYKTAYQALTMASIVEKETGRKSERDMIASVFVNRLKIGMLLQTDPSVIYGMGARYQGHISKSDLGTDTPYNTYMRPGLPPTPISLPGVAALHAALAPAKSDALYFVARGDGSSQFSASLPEHNRAVNKYIRGLTGR